MAAADPNVQMTLNTIERTFVDFNQKFLNTDGEIAELKKEVDEAKPVIEDMGKILQRDVGANIVTDSWLRFLDLVAFHKFVHYGVAASEKDAELQE